jgi:carboxymethylenebutenolidase
VFSTDSSKNLTLTKALTMKKLTKEDISQEVFDLYDDYAHNKIDRRRFVEKLSLFAVGALTVPSLLSFMTPNYVDSVLIKPGDPRLKSEFITYESPKGGGKIKALLSQPTGTKETARNHQYTKIVD